MKVIKKSIKNKQKQRQKNRQRTIKRRRSHILKYGGKKSDDDDDDEPKGHKTPEEIIEEVKKSQQISLPSISSISSNKDDSSVLEKATDVAQGVTVNVLDTAGNLLGVDLENKEQTDRKLEKISKTLANPETAEKVKDVAVNAGKLGYEVGEQLVPIVAPVVYTAVNSGKKALDKTVSAITTTGSNFIKGIPVVGIPFIIAQDVAKFTEAGLAGAVAFADVSKAAFTATSASIRSMNQLVREKKDLIDKTQESISEFTSPSSDFSPYDSKKKSSKNGGAKAKRRLFKSKKHKGKRVRFAE